MKSVYGIFKKIRSDSVRRILERKAQKNLKNDNFTLISNNCMAGMIYHNLSLQFTSPSINLWIGETPADYIRFLKNLDYYLNSELNFIHDGCDKYPRAYLGDVKIGFVHFKTETQARESWNKRKNRIMPDRIWIIAYYENGVSKEEYVEIKSLGFKNAVIIADDSKSVRFCDVKLKKTEREHEWYSADKSGVRVFEKYFDYVEFLNTNS